jgi:Fe-S cluster biogenesis protein NfuA
MPKIAEIEGTPNPNAKKFILKEPLTWGISRSYDNAEQAHEDSLAAQLFAIDHVTNVFYVDHWITVTQDGEAEWPELLRKLADPIRNAPSAEIQSQQQYGTTTFTPNVEEMTPEEQERFARISELLDEQVRPYLQGDGGDLYVVGLKGNTLEVHYQGACGSCPSSISGTLAGIEGLVRSIEPDIEVVAV